MTLHRLTLWLLYGITLLTIFLLVLRSAGYYSEALSTRPHHGMHANLKPSGTIGHGLGIVGSGLMLILLLYSLRKRARWMHNAGNIRYWLNYHIWMGVTGPLLVIFHTAFKLGGIVAVSFWSMIGVALSGVLGRYLYSQIPRTLGGQELSAHDLEEMDRQFTAELQETYRLDRETLAMIMGAAGGTGTKGGWGMLLQRWREDLTLPLTFRAIAQRLKQVSHLDAENAAQVMKIVRKKVRLKRRAAFLTTAQTLLHHWHVIHRPFAIVMLVIMIVHVVVAILFGYRWLFGPAGGGA